MRIAIFALLVACVCAAPAVTNSMWQVSDAHVESTNFKVAFFKITFDQDIFIRDQGVNKAIGSASTYQKRWTLYTKAGLTWQCGNFQIAANDTQINGPPPYLMGVRATNEILGTFFSEVFNAYNAEAGGSGNDPRSIAGIYILKATGKFNLNSPLDEAQLNTCMGGTVSWTNGNVVDQAGAATTASSYAFNKAANVPPCTEQGINEVQREMRRMFGLFRNMDDPRQLSNLINGINSVTSRQPYVGCIKRFGPFFEANRQETFQVNSRACGVQDRNSDAWKNDPCCNQALRWSSCCNPRAVNESYEVQGRVRPGPIAGVCSSPQKIFRMLQAFRRDLNANNKPSGTCNVNFKRDVPDQLYETRVAFRQECWDAIFKDRNCKSDSDCNEYGDLACVEEGYNSGNFKCERPWDNPDPFLFACYLDRMDNRTRQFNQKAWNLPVDVSRTTYETEFKQRMSSMDCAGSDTDPRCVNMDATQVTCGSMGGSWDFQGQWCVDYSASYQPSTCTKNGFKMMFRRSYSTYEKNPATGNYEPKYYPGNRTECERRKLCSYNFWENRNKAQCEAKKGYQANGKTYFCGECWGPYCSDQSWPTMCQVWALQNQQQCEGAGYSWEQDQWNQWRCVANNNTEGSCLPSSICPRSDPMAKGDDAEWRCNRRRCYTNDNRTACQARGFAYYWDEQWGNGNGLCVDRLNEWNPSGCSAKPGHSYFYGHRFQRGRFDTPQRCAEGRCVVHNHGGRPFNSTECAAQRFCTQQCRKCESTNRNDALSQVLCKNATVTDSTTCGEIKGEWKSNTCVLTRRYPDRTQCIAAGLTWNTCDMQSFDTCTSNADQALLSCRWNDWAPCSTPGQCQATGQCEDYFARGGACVTRRVANNNGWSQCPEGANQVSQALCKSNDNNANQNRTICEAMGPQWTFYEQQAFNQSACNAYGMGCFDSWNNYVGHATPQACRACGHEWKHVTKWTQGRWMPGYMRPMEWRVREERQINTWKQTMNRSRVDLMVNRAILSDMGEGVTTFFQCRYNPIFSALRTAACDCGTTKGGACFNVSGDLDDFNVAVKTMFPSAQQQGVSSNEASITAGPGTFTQTTEMTMGVVPAAAYAKENGTNSNNNNAASASVVQRLRSFVERVVSPMATGNSAEFAVVPNANGAIVGQLVGDGVNVQSSSSLASGVTLCASLDPDIDVDASTYPTKDFSMGDAQTKPGVPLQKTVSVNGDGQYCTTVTQAGLYFPINRMTNYANVTPAPTPTPGPSSSATPTPTASPTPTATPTATTSDASSSFAFSFGTLCAVVLAAMLLAM